MYSSRLQQFHIIKQGNSLDRITSKGQSLTKLLHDLVREYGKYNPRHAFDVNLSDFTLTEKRLLISHIVDSEEYAWACESPTNTEALFYDNRTHIESMINEEKWQVLQEAEEEARSHK